MALKQFLSFLFKIYIKFDTNEQVPLLVFSTNRLLVFNEFIRRIFEVNFFLKIRVTPIIWLLHNTLRYINCL